MRPQRPTLRLPGHPPVEPCEADPGGITGRLQARLGRLGIGIAGCVGGVVTMAALGMMAWTTGLPWLFPSLAPTTLLMFETPLAEQASPRNALAGHGVAIVVGYGSLVVFGLQHTGAVTQVGTSLARVAATALALGLTTLLLRVLGTPHSPSGASVLLISLGLLRTPIQLAVMAGAALLTTLLAWGLNRLAGVRATFAPRPIPIGRKNRRNCA